MAKLWLVLCFFCVMLLVHRSKQLQSSQAEALPRIQRLLNFPSALSGWINSTDFCNMEANSAVTVGCYEDSIMQLHIIGKKGAPVLPRNFSIDSFVTTLVSLPDLKVLTLVSLGLWGSLPGKIAQLTSLEILNMSSNFLYGPIPKDFQSLTSLQTLVLEDNMLTGQIPNWIGALPLLTVLSVSKNMLNGTLPNSISLLDNLRILSLSKNYFKGDVPDLRGLKSLQVLDLDDNAFGPEFPKLGNKLITLTLRKNQFRAGLPAEMSSYYQLQRLDLADNKFVGPFPSSILSLPSISYVNISDNKFTGMLFENQSCNADLEFVDLSSNLLMGYLPNCLVSQSMRKVFYAGNCLQTEDSNQLPESFCHKEALAVGIVPRQNKSRKAFKSVFAISVTVGVVGGISLVALIFFLVRKLTVRRMYRKPLTRLILENASAGYPSKLLSDARYISQTMKTGVLGIQSYRTFSLEELEDATNNFDTTAFVSEGSQGQMYRGRLKNGSYIAIKCLEMKRKQSTQKFTHHIELISKLRHIHLVSVLGHCFECHLDDSTVSRIFLVFEYVPNRTLRSWLSEEQSRCQYNWTHRIAAAIGVAKGIQFLHTGIVPGLYSNNLKITDVLLDQNLVAKISTYNLPPLREITGESKYPRDSARVNQGEKNDIYDFGLILLEIILGRPMKSTDELDSLQDQLQEIVTSDNASTSVFDLVTFRTCSAQSLKTMIEVCIGCLHKNPADKPSIEDVLWNLQFAAQVQEAQRGDSPSSEGSLSP